MKKMAALICFIQLMTAAAWAQQKTGVENSGQETYWSFGVLSETRFERDENQSVVNKNLGGGYLGLDWGVWGARLSYLSFSETTGNQTLGIRRTHEDIFLWGHMDSNLDWWLKPYFLLGVGSFREKVDTVLMSESSEQVGDWQLQAGAGMGLRADVFKFVSVAIEIHSVFGDGYSPNPMLGFATLLGIKF